MKFLHIKLNEKKYPIVCTEVLETFNALKAEMVVEIGDDDVSKLSGTYTDYEIKGFHCDYAELLFDGEMDERELYVDFVESVGSWAKCYIYINLVD